MSQQQHHHQVVVAAAGSRRSSTSSTSSAASAATPAAPADPRAAVAPGRLGTGQCLHVLDPLVKGGKVPVPLAQTFNTKGRTDWLAGKARRDLSVCCLFHKGRCFSDKNCHQVHVDRATLDAIRHEYRNVVSCCLHCRDNGSLTEEANSQLWSLKGFSEIEMVFFQCEHASASAAVSASAPAATPDIVTVPRERLGFTTGLVESFTGLRLHAGMKAFSLPASRICRLHLRDDCKYGRDCKNIHVCRPSFARAFGVEWTSAAAAFAAAAPSTIIGGKVATSSSISATAGQPAALTTFQPTPTIAAADLVVPSKQQLFQPQPAPAFLRANYPTLDQSSLRMAHDNDDCLEITFRPFDRLCDFDGLSPTAALDIFGASPASTTGTAASSTVKARQSSAVLDSPTSFFHAMASPM